MYRLNIETSAAYAIGDLHGRFETLMFYVKHYDLQECLLIINGDIGLGFGSIEADRLSLTALNKLSVERNIQVCMFRGNHDDPSRFNCETPLFAELTNVHLLHDYTVLTITNSNDERHVVNILCVGGGISVDRQARKGRMIWNVSAYLFFHKCSEEEAKSKVRKEYWDDENVLFDEDYLNSNLCNSLGLPIHIVCTHTAPSFAYPVGKEGIESMLAKDKNLSIDLDVERATVSQLYQWLKKHDHPIETWCYAHFHAHHSEIIDNTDFRLIDMVTDKKMDYYQIF